MLFTGKAYYLQIKWDDSNIQSYTHAKKPKFIHTLSFITSEANLGFIFTLIEL